mgnify:CR=1 FL=1
MSMDSPQYDAIVVGAALGVAGALLQGVFANPLAEPGVIGVSSGAAVGAATVIVLGDGRGNGKDPRLSTFEEITRRARSTIWLTPEPRFSWTLGGCDLPLYAEYCDRVQVVRNLRGLERVSTAMATPGVGGR